MPSDEYAPPDAAAPNDPSSDARQAFVAAAPRAPTELSIRTDRQRLDETASGQVIQPIAPALNRTETAETARGGPLSSADSVGGKHEKPDTPHGTREESTGRLEPPVSNRTPSASVQLVEPAFESAEPADLRENWPKTSVPASPSRAPETARSIAREGRTITSETIPRPTRKPAVPAISTLAAERRSERSKNVLRLEQLAGTGPPAGDASVPAFVRCEPYLSAINHAGENRPVRGQACMTAGGEWHLMNQEPR
jgi:hypothetical protein